MRVRLIPAPEPLTPDCGAEQARVPAALAQTGRADGGEVEDHTFTPGPLAPALASFTARTEGKRIMLAWETVDEHDLAGFHVYRSRSSEGPWERVNDEFIPAHAPGSGMAWSYAYEDVVNEDGIWWHRLTGLDLGGHQAFEAPAQSQTSTPTALHLTGFRAVPTRRASAALFLFLPVAGLVVLLLRRADRTSGPS
jgi:hypothetical protein